MYLEQKMRSTQTQKWKRIDPFLTKLQETRDELTAVESTPQGSEMARQALNSISKEWQVFVQSILSRATLPNWNEMWAALKQDELRRDLVKCKLDGSSSSGSKPKEEDENAALASKGQQEQQKPKDILKTKCFRCGEMGHYATRCHLRKKVKDEKHDPKVAAGKIEDEFAMRAEIPPGGRWADLEL